eukprot:2181881-Alexandrium_andersonii.AAC.1
MAAAALECMAKHTPPAPPPACLPALRAAPPVASVPAMRRLPRALDVRAAELMEFALANLNEAVASGAEPMQQELAT